MSQKIPLIVADLEVQLATAISVGATSFDISSNEDDDGNTIPNGKYVFTVDNGNSAKEYLQGDLVDTTVSNVKSISRQGAETTGAVRAHRVGASVILTDFLAIKAVADALRGAATLDGSSPISYDTTPSLSDGKQLATVAYVLSVVTGGTVNFSIQSVTGVAGEALAANDIVYFKESDQRWWKADADVAASYVQVRLAVNLATAASAGASMTAQLLGPIGGFTSLTAGAKYYLSNTAGGVSSTPGTIETFLGTAINTTTILFAPNFIYMPTKYEKDFLSSNSMQTYSPSAAGTATLDIDAYTEHRITMPAGNITIALTGGSGCRKFLVSITQDSGGSRTVTWFSTIRWASGSAPTLTTTANKRDTFCFIRTGTNTYDGYVVGQNI